MVSNNIVNIHLDNKYAITWHTCTIDDAKIWIRGTVYNDGRFYHKDDIAEPIAKISSILKNNKSDELGTILNQLNGFFSVVIEKDNIVFATVDRVRSIPLFYGQVNNEVYISDDAEWIRQHVGDNEMDSFARKEFLFTGYVTGQETLFPNIKQLQAGEFLLARDNESDLKLETYRYYRFLHDEPAEPINEEVLLEELIAVSEKVVQRLIEYANGRQIVVPLSGGYDSRLIVTLLRKFSYENVLTFSYGAPGNKESQISKIVSECLNYKWEFVQYSNTLWRQWWNTKERNDYQCWASNWTSVPIFQDWPSVWCLKQTGKLKQNAIFTPGHTGDVISGSHIPQDINLTFKASLSDLYKALIDAHYCLMSWNCAVSNELDKWNERILCCTEAEIFEKGGDLVNWFEKWEWQERQAKFIINSVRAYEFWGYDWYLPLWDRDFIIFWQGVPLHLRKKQILYIRMVKNLYERQCSSLGKISFLDDGEKSVDPSYLRILMKKIFIYLFSNNAYNFLKNIKEYYLHPLRWYGVININNFIRLFLNDRNKTINSVLTYLYFLDVDKIYRKTK